LQKQDKVLCKFEKRAYVTYNLVINNTVLTIYRLLTQPLGRFFISSVAFLRDVTSHEFTLVS